MLRSLQRTYRVFLCRVCQRLQGLHGVIAASLNLDSPEYEIVESGPDHDKSFVAVAIVGSEKFASGEGKSKREAEQAAAKLAHEVLSSRSKNK